MPVVTPASTGDVSHNSPCGGVRVVKHGRALVFAIDPRTRELRVLRVLRGEAKEAEDKKGGSCLGGDTEAPAAEEVVGKHPEVLQTLMAAGHRTSCFAVVGGADVVITGGEEGKLIAWNYKSGVQLWKYEGHRRAVTSVAVSGDYVVSGSVDKTVRCLKLGTQQQEGEEVWKCEGHRGAVSSVAVSGDYVVSGSGDGTVRCLKLETEKQEGEEVWKYEGHRGAVSSVAVSGDYVVSGSYDETVRCLKLETEQQEGEEAWNYEGHGGAVSSVAVSGDYVVSGSDDGTVRCLKLETEQQEGEEVWKYEGHGNRVKSVAVSGAYVVSGSYDETVRCLKLDAEQQEGEEVWKYEGHRRAVTSVAVSGDYVVSGSHDETVRCLKLDAEQQEGEEVWKYEGHRRAVSSVAVSGDYVVSGSDDGTVRCLKLETEQQEGEEVWKCEGHRSTVRSVAVSGDYVVSGSYDGTVRCLKLETEQQEGEEAWNYEGHRGAVTSVAVSGAYVVSGSADGTVRCLKLETQQQEGEEVWKYEGHRGAVTSVAVSGAYVVSGSYDNAVRCLKLDTGQQEGEEAWKYEGHRSVVSSVAVSGDYVVSRSGGPRDETVRCLKLETEQKEGEEVWKYEGHGGAVSSVAVSGDYVVSGSDDGTVRCLKLETGELQTAKLPQDASARAETSEVPDLGSRVESVIVVQKHRLVVAGCSNGTLGVFRLDDWHPIAKLVDQHTSTVRALATAGDSNTVFSSSTKIMRTDLKALTSRGTIVASVELEDYNDRFKRFMSLTKPHLDYKLKALKELYTTAQLASFGFTAASVPEHKELREAMEWVRHLGISTEGLFPPIFATACSMVCLFAVIVVVQESVEFRKFVNPNSTMMKYLWLAMSVYCELLSTVFFVPVCRVLARAGDCTYDRGFGSDIGSGSGSSTDGGGLMWLDAMLPPDHTAGGLECFHGTHWLYVGIGSTLFLVYVGLSARLMRVGGELQNIEVVCNPFNWRGDSKKHMPYKHALSVATAEHAMWTVAIKTVAVLSTTFLGTMHPTAVATIMVILGVLLLGVTLMYPPYYGRGGTDESDTSICKSGTSMCKSSTSDESKGRRWYERTGANLLRVYIELGMLWTYICALVAILLHTNTSNESHEGTRKLTSTVMLVLMVIPSAIPFLVAGQHYCWPVLKSVLPTTCSTACCQSCDANDTKYSLVDRQDRTSSAHEMPNTSVEQTLQEEGP